MKTIKLISAIIVLSLLTSLVYAQQEDKGLGKGTINPNQGGGNQNETVKKETKGGVDIDKKQENTQKSEKKGNVQPTDQQTQNNKVKQGEEQKNEKEKSGKEDKAVTDNDKPEKTRNEGYKEVEEQERSDNGQHKGHAYGKDKDGMTGHEFGKIRSEEAKTKVNTKLDEAVSDLDLEIEKLDILQQDIEASKIRNEEKYKSKQISKEQYDENKVKINEAENRVLQNREKIILEKESLKNARLDIQ